MAASTSRRITMITTKRRDRRRVGAPVWIALLVVACWGAVAAPAQADFGVSRFETTLHAPSGYDPFSFAPFPDLTAESQAGSHPDLTTDFSINTMPDQGTNGGRPITDGHVRDVEVDLPAGFYGDPGVVPTCDPGDFAAGATLGPFGNCPVDTQVGVNYVQTTDNPNDPNEILGAYVPVYNVEPRANELAAFAFKLGAANQLRISVRSDGDYGIRATIRGIIQGVRIFGSRLTLWGVPADPIHDPERIDVSSFTWNVPSSQPRRPFLTLPTNCDGPLKATIRARSWEAPDTWVTAEDDLGQPTGCDKLKFEPTVKVTPDTTKADSPAGYEVQMSVPQDESPDGLSTPTMKKAVVTLPEGVSIAPPSAIGLEACTAEQDNLGTTEDVDCPETSKVGTVSIRTPLLDDPLEGDVYLRSPEPNQLFRLLIVARGPGLVVKIPGIAQPDKTTGQITATFDNTPQLPFDLLTVKFRGGDRAPLANPQTCGTKTTTTQLTPHAGVAATPSAQFDITDCVPGQPGFDPTFEAGTLNPFAGAFSPFTMTIRRGDGQQDLKSIALDMPPGLLGSVRGVPQCAEAQAATGQCPESTRVGSTTVSAGSGATPFSLPGKVFFAGPYKGAPFSLSVVVRAIAGPFDLGTVVVRAPINVDAATAKLGVPADPLPTILEGVPLRLRMVNITIDRPNFMFNATNCDAMRIGATITSTGGAVVRPNAGYQAKGCANLPVQPKLGLTMRGAKEVTDGKHPGLDASMTQAPGEAGLKRVAVKLPLSLALDPDNAQALCKPGEAVARRCPAGSIVGRATAVTSALNQPLSGPVYFVENTRRTASGNVVRTLPKLWLALQGEVPLDLYAESTVVDDHLVATFNTIPDAPITSFALSIAGGKNGILAATQSICEKSQIASVTFDGQNGRRVSQDIDMGSECGYRVAAAKASSTGVTVTVSGLGAGKLELSGKGLTKTRRTIKQAKIARATAKLSKASRRTLRAKGRFTTRVTVKFTPAGGGKPKTTGMKVTFKR